MAPVIPSRPARSPWSAPRTLVRRARRRVLLHRRGLSALCAGLAVLVALGAASPSAAPTVQAWTAASDLPGGSVLRPGSVVAREVPPDALPDDAVTDPRQVVGRVLAAPVTRGETLTRLRVVQGRLLRGYPGRTAVPLRVADGTAVSLLRVGDRVSFVLADPDGRAAPELLVDDVPVVALPAGGASASEGAPPGRLVVVAVPDLAATRVAARAATAVLIPVWKD
ncbi:SAF domain-containing protein [Nocardioides aurantiacus]|uniref:Flp pilus assembly protein CpaB n=1 Tax=Nocardioides aurantiacus TaxID=86796 RepID=A0A3N2CRG7_9ACTN|nr:SAF domain-containing protein [Nocardioides aurantiacus]ROR90006.1 Flp pilus assembly protein CpaB [Nocardioides aurantiacus]